MAEPFWITRLLNGIFAGPVDALLNAVGVHPANPARPINDTFALEVFVAFCMVVFFVIVRLTLSVEKPGFAQHIAEMVNEFVGSQAEQVIGHHYQRYMAFVTCVVLFVLFNNVLGLLPGVVTPTSAPVVPLGIALCTFVYYHYHGFREQGLIGYMKHFAGPIWWIAWLLFPIELISHFARIMSLTIRLFANMFASDLLTLVTFSGVPFVLPVAPLALHFAVSLIQAYVFMLLTMIYVGQAVSHEH